MEFAQKRLHLVQAVKRDMLRFLESPPAAPLGGLCDTLSRHFQALAICHFIEHLDLAEFGIHLRRSACARRFFLERARAEGHAEDRFLAISRSEAFFDAVAGGNRPLARDIVAASRPDRDPEREGEAEFRYFSALHALLSAPQDADAGRAEALRRLSDTCVGIASHRLSVGRALLEGDAEAFRTGLEALLAAKCDADRARMWGVPPEDPVFWPRCRLSIEGLALIRLASLRGLGDAALPRHPLCPRAALLPWTDTPGEDIFRKMRLEAERPDRVLLEQEGA